MTDKLSTRMREAAKILEEATARTGSNVESWSPSGLRIFADIYENEDRKEQQVDELAQVLYYSDCAGHEIVAAWESIYFQKRYIVQAKAAIKRGWSKQ